MNKTEVDHVLNILRDNCFMSRIVNQVKEQGYCEAVFDSFYCWDKTEAGDLAATTLFEQTAAGHRGGLATRQCTGNGTWFIPENGTDPWTNLTQCGKLFINIDMPSIYMEWIPIIKNISYFGYAISIVSLIFALSIFINIKRLHCPRNKLHMNLFLSFILRFFMSILKDGLFVKGTALFYDTDYIEGEPKFLREFNYSWVCKAIISIRWYFILSNFMLMLMEGVYLHNLMFLNLFSDNHGITAYYVLGWGLPLLFVIPWIIVRVLYEDVFCWTQKENSYIALIIEVPIRITIVINFILFLIIVKVLVVKLNNACIQQRKIKYRKLLKATLILIPLFGVPYSLSLLMSFYIDRSQILEIIWLFLDQTFTAFQFMLFISGIIRALLYCLMNSEVQIEIKRKYSSLKNTSHKEFRRSRTISNTQQFCMQGTDEFPENPHQHENGVGNGIDEIKV
ncbi:hypothetical protein NQ317_003518 [Molorchus minor]|uniref:Uncharacterized protein n=1 Tax=Molorchus minor TaxID=1323400 RepID=A0ABQ9K181_9CUCU|nr:hypothetical protein NQ317_003518 [Molorchus minor]